MKLILVNLPGKQIYIRIYLPDCDGLSFVSNKNDKFNGGKDD